MTVIQPLINVPTPHKLTVADFLLLNEAGAFRHHSKTELIDGAIYFMNAQMIAHAYAKTELAFRLRTALQDVGSPLRVLVEGTVEMQPNSAPEPDIGLASVAPGTRTFVPCDQLKLVVEVADTSVPFDLGKKLALYASQGVPEYWVLDIPAAIFHQFWTPSGSAYARTRDVPVGQSVTSDPILGLTVETDGLI